MTTAAPALTTYAQALVASSSDAILAALFSDMAGLGVEIAGFDPFSVQMGLPQLQARAEAALQALRVQIVQGGNPSTAALAGDDWLDATLQGWFREVRLGATKSRWNCTIQAAAGVGPTVLQPGDLVAQAETGVTFVSISGAAIPKGGSGTILFDAQTAGTTGNPATGQLDHLIVSPAGLSITNPTGSIVLAGTDKEANVAYLTRCLGKWGTLGAGGNTVAYNFLIPQAAPTATRFFVRDDNPFGPGTIGVALANAAGPASDVEVGAVASSLQPRKPLGSGALTVFPANARVITIGGSLIHDGTNPNVLTQARAALATMSATYPIGGINFFEKFYIDQVIAAIMAVPGMQTINGLTPSSDIALMPYDVVSLISALVDGTE
jgi:hypothetical protein